MSTPQSPGHEFWERVLELVDQELKNTPTRRITSCDQHNLWITSLIGRKVMELYNKPYKNELGISNIVEFKNREQRR